MNTIYMAGPWITDHEVKTVMDALTNGWYEHPYDYVEKFQKEFAAYHGRAYGIMTPNCTTAIHLLLTCLGIGPGDEVIVPDCTWIATAAPITYLGATPVFADIDPGHWCLDLRSVEERITKKTKAIMAVDLFGNMPDMDALRSVAKRNNLFLIEDAAEALGSMHKRKKAGSFGVGSVFSFHRTKTLVTGEGGMLLLDDKELYDRCMMWRDHGRKPGGLTYYNYAVTYKYMPFNLQAALGYAQFQRLDELVKKKRWIFDSYVKNLSDVDDLMFNPEPVEGFNSVWITGLVFGKKHRLTKKAAMQKLADINVPSRPFFYPLTSLPAYEQYTEQYKGKNPVAYDVSDRGINLPGALNLTEEQINFVCEGIKKIVKQ